MYWTLGALVGLMTVVIPYQATQESPQFDQLLLTNGTRLEGLITRESAQEIHFQYIVKKPGLRTLVFEVPFDRSEIAGINKATEPGRSRAKEIIAGLLAGKNREEKAASKLRLQRAPWIVGNEPAWRYQGQYFDLHSNAQEDLVRLVCVRLDEIFAAYVNTLGTKQSSVPPTRILLFRTFEDYQHWQKQRSLSFLNPAYYDPRQHEIIAGSDLQRLERELRELREKHATQLTAIEKQRQHLLRHFNDQPPANQIKQLRQTTLQLRTINQENELAMAGVQSAFFATLFHEAFHAYLDRWVYPSAQHSVPRWLNEGLAQLFENAFVEIGELRVGRINEQRLQAIQEDVRRGRLIGLREIVQAPSQQFLVQHTLDAFEADRYYQSAWALAHFLTFHLHLLNTPKFSDYVAKTARQDEVASFEKLTGMPLADCEKAWKDYLLRLRPDGTLRP